MPYRKILVGTDGSDRATGAVEAAATLAASEKADLVIVHVLPATAPDSIGEEVLARASDAARRQGVTASTRALRGQPVDMLIRLARQEGADLIAVGNRGMSGAERFLIGNVPNKVSHHTPCDLLVVHTKG